MKQERKCECETKGVLQPGADVMYDSEKELPYVVHKPNKCECTNELKKYIRKGKIHQKRKKVWLCSNCCLSTDKEV